MAMLTAWQEYSEAPSLDQAGRYPLMWSFYAGTWRQDPKVMATMRRNNPALYRNTRQLVKSTDAIVSLYDQYCYAGDLSTDGRPLPDGSRGAIPIDPQTGNEGADQRLTTAIHQLWAIWNWRQQMSMMPKYAAILGDLLIELIDDVDRGVVMPRFVWPGMVPDQDLVLDDAGNVKQYAVEYEVEIPASDGAFGITRQAETYTFRKEVDGDWFRYYKNGRPHDYTEMGLKSKEENPYGFVPAVWCRHEILIDGNRGMGAFEKTLTTAMELNSTLSAAMDYQVKMFRAPVGVVDGDDSTLQGLRGTSITLPGGTQLGGVSPDERVARERRAAVDKLPLLPMGPSGKFVTVDFNLGGTKDLLTLLIDGMGNENPEAEYGKKLLELKQGTGPGVSRILSPIVGRVKAVRKNHDPQQVKLVQMGITMMGFRLNSQAYPPALVQARRARYDAFRPFNLDSWDKGLLDCSIPDRDVFSESLEEKATRLVLVEGLKTRWAMLQAGVPEEDVDEIMGEREKAAQALADATLADDLDQQDVQDDQAAEAAPAARTARGSN